MSEEKDTMRKKFKRKVMVGVGFLLALGGGAFAAILISALMTGTLNTVAAPTLTWNAASTMHPVKQLSTDGSGIVCAPTVSNGKLNVDISNAMPGASCRIQGWTKTTSDNLKVQGVTMNNVTAQFVDTTAEGTEAMVSKRSYKCGDTLGMHNASSSGKLLNMPFVLDITIPQNATAGTSAISGKIDAVPPAQYDPALCSN